jgi:hypothetical protein
MAGRDRSRDPGIASRKDSLTVACDTPRPAIDVDRR